jgi:hypothetical protein
MATTMGTNGGGGGTDGARRRLALVLGGGFALILLAVMLANAESTMSDMAAAGIRETKAHVWLWEASSIVSWLVVMPMIWWLVAHVRPPRFAWGVVALLIVLASVPLSLLHMALMVGLRKLYYAAEGSQYRFLSRFANPLLYEYRKDFASYLQFAGLAAVAQWLLARAALPVIAAESPRILLVADGAVTHQVPAGEIDHVTAAGNYVELAWGERTLLHRATLAAVAAELGAGFVRIHRSRLVRRAAIRRVETDKSGDFTVTLASGGALRGSRRYRDSVQG